MDTRATVKARLKRWGTFVAYGCGHVQNDMCAAVWFQFYLLYVKEVLGTEMSSAEELHFQSYPLHNMNHIGRSERHAGKNLFSMHIDEATNL